MPQPRRLLLPLMMPPVRPAVPAATLPTVRMPTPSRRPSRWRTPSASTGSSLRRCYLRGRRRHLPQHRQHRQQRQHQPQKLSPERSRIPCTGRSGWDEVWDRRRQSDNNKKERGQDELLRVGHCGAAVRVTRWQSLSILARRQHQRLLDCYSICHYRMDRREGLGSVWVAPRRPCCCRARSWYPSHRTGPLLLSTAPWRNPSPSSLRSATMSSRCTPGSPRRRRGVLEPWRWCTMDYW